MSQQFNVSPDNLWMAVDYIADFENCCYSLKADRLAFTIQKPASEEIAIDLRQARFWIASGLPPIHPEPDTRCRSR